MHERKYFMPTEGMLVIDPLNRKAVPAGGKWVAADSFWHRRVADGGGTLSDEVPEGTASQEPPRMAPALAPPGSQHD